MNTTPEIPLRDRGDHGATIIFLRRCVLYTIPAIAAVRNFHHDGLGRPCWLEWTGLGLAATVLTVAESMELVRLHSVTRGAGSWVMGTLVRGATMLVALALGAFVCRIGTGSGRRDGAA
jgi:hypothetical protein